jgi:hypothetical protein
VQIEFGLDVAGVERHPDLLSVQLKPAFDSRTIHWLGDAMRATYGRVFEIGALLRSHAAVVRSHRHALLLARYAVQRLRRHKTGPHLAQFAFLALTRRLVASASKHCKLAALFDPLAPPPSLRAATDRVIDAFPCMVERQLETQLTLLPDYDLETGGVEDPSNPTLTARADLGALAARGVTIEGQPPLGIAA